MTNSRLTDPEVLEWRFPVRLESFAIRRGSGGAGRHRGGDGAVRRVRFLEPMTAVMLANHRRVAPFGVAGGMPGALGRNWVERADGTREEFGATCAVEMRAGDVFVIETPGGGGFGAPEVSRGATPPASPAPERIISRHRVNGESMAGIYDFKVKDIHGKPVELDAYKGKVLLIVNTASKCGFTPQYKGLEQLYQKFHGKGLEILGFPCNQFGAQEPGSEEEIESFCEVNYGVTFPLFAKIDVNGNDAAPLYQYLKHAKPGLLGSRSDQVELHQVPGRPRRQRRRALRAERRAGEPRTATSRSFCDARRRLSRDGASRRRCARACRSRGCRRRAQADPNKVLRVVFPVAETGFDPQAWIDDYSNYINRAIFDPLYRYDYLARPYRIVPNTAAALPDDLRGRAQLDDQDQAGHLLRRRSGVQGKEARARRRRLRLLVEADSRPEDPFAESPGVRPALRRRRRGGRESEGDGQVRLRRAGRGTARCRPLHAAAQADASGLQPPVRPHDYTHGSGRARSDRGLRRRELVGDGEPGRHRSLPLAGMAPRPEDRSGSEPRLSQGALSRKRRSRGQARSWRR